MKTDKTSRCFALERGVKQGDPLSSLLFNAVLEQLFQQLKANWSHKNYGVQLGHTSTTILTNIRFADDVMLVASTLPQLTTMLTQLRQQAKQYGLELHPDKTKILTNLSKRRGRDARTSVDVDGEPVSILHYHQYVKYLGRKVCFDEYHKTELDNRIASAWGKFHLLRHELTSKHYPLNSRLKLFNSTITPTVMYGSAAWTMNKNMETTLQRAQRRMLRLIIGTPRRKTKQATPDDNHSVHSTDDVASNTSSTNLEHLIELTDQELLEPWPDFIKRATRTAEAHLERLNIEDWTTLYLRKNGDGQRESHSNRTTDGLDS